MGQFDADQANRDLEETGKRPAWVTEHLRLYRESGGAEGHLFEATVAGVPGIVPCLLLTTIGRRSGKKLTSPLFYTMAGEAYIVAGSKGGSDKQPGWYLNLRANPVVDVQVGREQFTTHARVATGKAKRTHARALTPTFPIYAILLQPTKDRGFQQRFAAKCHWLTL
jgi:deazaflavin-dependent oxidoreductase (nitroreductase family)